MPLKIPVPVLPLPFGMTAGLETRIEAALDTVRPFLKADGGDVEVVSISGNNNLVLRFLGSCNSCSMSDMTLKAGIEDTLRRSIPELGTITAIKA
jgi:Fe-S cluster biogenesis protein NfuA